MFVIQYIVANLMLLLLLFTIWTALAARDKVRGNRASFNIGPNLKRSTPSIGLPMSELFNFAG